MPESPNRYFSAIFGVDKSAPTFPYAYSPLTTITGNSPTFTGAWMPVLSPLVVTPTINGVSGAGFPSTLSGILLVSNPTRVRAYIQVVSTGVLWVGYGSAPGTGSAMFLLKAASAENAGDGGILNETAYNGNIFVSGITRVISWQA